MAATVTIGKTYFEALLRRAEFHTSGGDDANNVNADGVTIPRAEHEYLLHAVREYNILKTALFRGGLTPETLDILIAGEDASTVENARRRDSAWEGPFRRPTTVPVTISSPKVEQSSPQTSGPTAVGNGFLNRPQPSFNRSSSFGFGPSSVDTKDKDDHFITDNFDNQPQKAPYPRNDRRTILFTNLSDRTSHKDLVSIIRGGRLLDIFVRSDRSATVSFVEGASEFLAFAKRNDIYINDKRVEIRWNDRQFHLPGHVANKIAIGATRNLVIRDTAGKLTESGIRDDLNHIHNLVVIDVTFKDGDAYISTNSVHNALFARTCMMSRALYKGMKIEWYPDECAAPLPVVSKQSWKEPSPVPQPKKSSLMPLTNMFNVLNMDGTEDGSEDGSEEGEITNFGGHGVGLNWATTGVVA